jgi:hypothetical protein
MDTPVANADGYTQSSLMARADAVAAELRNRSAYLLVHGTAGDAPFGSMTPSTLSLIGCLFVCSDDNVHFQNAADLEATLTRLNLQYTVQWYTDQDHSLGAARRHLYTLIGAFLARESQCTPRRVQPQQDVS